MLIQSPHFYKKVKPIKQSEKTPSVPVVELPLLSFFLIFNLDADRRNAESRGFFYRIVAFKKTGE